MSQKLINSFHPRIGKTAKVLSICLASIFMIWLLLASCLALGFGGSPFDNNPFDDTVFNRSQWLEDQNCSDGSNRRGHMAQDIVHHLKRGMPEQDVIALLGAPEIYPEAKFRAFYGNGGYYLTTLPSSPNQHPDVVLRYYLGEELDMAWFIDRADLYLYFLNGRYLGSRIGCPS